MQIRCGTCHGSIWIQAPEGDDDWGVVACRACSQEYDLRVTLGARDLGELGKDAREFAQNAGIDLPAAYSVLLGIMTLGKVRDLYGRMSPSMAPARFDPSFNSAVEAGSLTPQQAAMRGKREVFARKLVERHGIPTDHALRVADNEMPLLEAVRQGTPATRIEVDFQPGRSAVRRVAMWASGLLAIAAVVTVVVFTRGGDEVTVPDHRQNTPKHRSVVASLNEVETELRFNARGQVTEVSGANPEAILRAFCRSLGGFTAEPVTLEAAGNNWTGLYRRRGILYEITIRRDPRRNLWVLGNGVDWARGHAVTER